MLVLNYVLLALDSILNSNKAMNLKAKSDLMDLTEFAFPYLVQNQKQKLQILTNYIPCKLCRLHPQIMYKSNMYFAL